MTAVIQPSDTVIIDTPGIYDGIPDEHYHADPVPAGSLSVSGAKRLLDCPAKFAHERKHGRPNKKEYDFGHIVHAFVLGEGRGVAEVEYDSWKTNAAQRQRDDAYAAGLVPVLSKDLAKARECAASVMRHPLAGALFDPTRGIPERSMFWVDDESGIWCRGRVDYMTTLRSGATAIVDLKTAESSKPSDLRRVIRRYSYDMQDPFYRAGASALGIGHLDFLFTFVEKEPPYVVTVGRINDHARDTGHRLNRRAITRYVECTTANHWPGYVGDYEIAEISEPGWVAHVDIEDL